MRRSAPLAAAFAPLLLSAAAGGAQAGGWPEVPLPADSSAEWVSRHMVYNGLDMRARRFHSPATPEDTVAFYRDAWRGRMVRDEVGGRTVLGHLADGHYVTVELVPSGAATQGTIGILRIPERPPATAAGHGFAKPAGSEVINDIRYLDAARETRTLMLQNRLSPYANQQFYRQRLAAQGWQSTSARACGAASTACSAEFEKKDGARMRMTVRRGDDGLSTVVANLE